MTNRTLTRGPSRPDMALLSAAEQYRADPALVETPLKARDALQLVIETKASGFPVPEAVEAATLYAARFATLYLPQARAGVADAEALLAAARNEDKDGAAVRKAAREGVGVVTQIKLAADRVEKAEKVLSERQRLFEAVRREERKARIAYHDALRSREAVEAWAEAWRDLWVDESAPDFLDLTFRQGAALKTAATAGKPLLEALYRMSLQRVTPREAKRLKELFAMGGAEMPTIEQVRAEAQAIEDASPLETQKRERAERRAVERAENIQAGAEMARSRIQRSDATVK